MIDNNFDLDSILGPDSGPSVRAIMASTLNGSTTISGRSHELGNAHDCALLHALRRWAELIVVGASTVQAEDYGGIQPSPTSPHPAPLAILSRTLLIDPRSRLCTTSSIAPIFVVPHQQLGKPQVASRAQILKECGAEIVDSGQGGIADALEALKALGFNKIICEGGPHVLSQLVHANAVDRLYLSLDPRLGTRVETPLTAGEGPIIHQRMCLEYVGWDEDGMVFLRYGRTDL